MFFAPRHLNHIAGLLVYYNYDNHYYLKMLREESGPVLYVSALVNQELTDYGPYPLPEGTASVRLRAELNKRELHFSYALEDGAWHQAGPVLDMMAISDEHVREWFHRLHAWGELLRLPGGRRRSRFQLSGLPGVPLSRLFAGCPGSPWGANAKPIFQASHA